MKLETATHGRINKRYEKLKIGLLFFLFSLRPWLLCLGFIFFSIFFLVSCLCAFLLPFSLSVYTHTHALLSVSVCLSFFFSSDSPFFILLSCLLRLFILSPSFTSVVISFTLFPLLFLAFLFATRIFLFSFRLTNSLLVILSCPLGLSLFLLLLFFSCFVVLLHYALMLPFSFHLGLCQKREAGQFTTREDSLMQQSLIRRRKVRLPVKGCAGRAGSALQTAN